MAATSIRKSWNARKDATSGMLTGKKILDFTSGQMCATVGHSHPNIVAAIKKSCDTALHLFSGMIPRSVVQLADKLAKIVPRPLSKSLLLSTGSESNEAAIKMAKLYTGGFEVIGLGGSWHGVTGNAGAVSYASDRKGYGPAMPGSFVIPEPNAYRCPVKHCRDHCDRTCMQIGFEMYDMQSTGAPAAIIAEPVISAGGVIVPPAGYFDALQAEARKRGMLLIFDEAQTAFGRLGHWFAASHLKVTPDIMTVSKTLGGGMPLAGVITTDEIEDRCHQRGFAFYTSHVSGSVAVDGGSRRRANDRGGKTAPAQPGYGRLSRRAARGAAGPLRGDWRHPRHGPAQGHRARPRPRNARAPSRAGRFDHPALPGTGPQHEHPPSAGTRVGVADRASADRHHRRHRSRHDHFRPGADGFARCFGAATDNGQGAARASRRGPARSVGIDENCESTLAADTRRISFMSGLRRPPRPALARPRPARR